MRIPDGPILVKCFEPASAVVWDHYVISLFLAFRAIGRGLEDHDQAKLETLHDSISPEQSMVTSLNVRCREHTEQWTAMWGTAPFFHFAIWVNSFFDQQGRRIHRSEYPLEILLQERIFDVAEWVCDRPKNETLRRFLVGERLPCTFGTKASVFVYEATRLNPDWAKDLLKSREMLPAPGHGFSILRDFASKRLREADRILAVPTTRRHLQSFLSECRGEIANSE